MTKSTGVGRGGRRPGAGRPRKLGIVGVEIVEKAARCVAEKDEAVNEAVNEYVKDAIQEQADDLGPYPSSATEIERLALATLRQIMRKAPQDGPRVAAAKETLARAERERAGMGGKKAAAMAVAEQRVAGGGKFSAPPPPGQRMQ